MQKKLLVTLVSSAFAGVAGVASAGPISVASVTTYAVEALSGGAPINFPGVAYSLTSPLANPSTQKVRFNVDSGVVSTCPTLTVSGAGSAAVTITPAGGPISATSCEYTVSVTGGAPVPSNATLNFAGGSVSSVSALLTSGGTLNVTVQVLTTANTVVESNSTLLANSGAAFTIAATNSASLSTPESSRINVASTPVASTTFIDGPIDVTVSAGTATAATGPVNLGRVRVSSVSGAQMMPDGTTPLNFTTATVETLSLTVTGSFGSGASLALHSNAACTAAIAGGGFTLNSARTSGTATVDINSVAATADEGGNKDVFICYSTAAGNVIPAAQFAVSGGFAGSVAGPGFTGPALASTNIYNLTLNGVQIDIRNHIPTSVTGWTNAYRIINTGAVAASFSAAYISVGGTVGTSSVIAANVPAGGTVVLSVPQIEAVLGAAPAGAPAGVGPRLRITAPTDSARVQVYGVQPNGSIFTNTDAQGADGGSTDQ